MINQSILLQEGAYRNMLASHIWRQEYVVGCQDHGQFPTLQIKGLVPNAFSGVGKRTGLHLLTLLLNFMGWLNI